ncbi:MAG: ATP-binding cassette domain-containing protein [Kiritimatiellia bacterium]
MANILEVRDLRVWFPVRKGVFARTVGFVKALDGVSFSLRRGLTLGVVGESGSGKSTLARVITGLQKPTAGTFAVDGRVAMVFQDPLGSLNPRMTVRATLREIVELSDGRIDGALGAASAPPSAAAPRRRSSDRTVVRLLELVGLDESALDKYPHEFSGGQRQRVCIARALASAPELLICDEAVSALDLSIRAQVLDLLAELKRRLGLSLLFITHDLGVVQHVADRVLVLNRGKTIEEGPCGQVLKAPREEYTRYLLRSVPRIGKPLT